MKKSLVSPKFRPFFLSTYLLLALGGCNSVDSTQVNIDSQYFKSILNRPVTKKNSNNFRNIFHVNKESRSARDSNSGTEALPFYSITQAIEKMKPGDAVFIHSGIYSESIKISNSGRKGLPITIQAYPGHEHRVIIKGAGIKLIGKSHINISGLRIEDSPDDGIYIEGPGTHIKIQNNEFNNTFGSAIAAWGVPWKQDPNRFNFLSIRNLLIENNNIKLANNGGWNEQITIANGVSGFEISGNEISLSGNTVNGGEGIDVKEGCSQGKIHHNLIYDIDRIGIYIDGGGLLNYPVPPTQGIDIYNNIINNIRGEGISLATEGKADIRNIRVHNNLVAGVRKNGIVLYDHPAGSGAANNIEIANNTTYNNGSDKKHRGGGIQVDFADASNVVLRNNIAYRNSNFQINVEDHSSVQLESNLTKNPLFENTAIGDFRLSENSPAIDAGSGNGISKLDLFGSNRLKGHKIDIGALEYGPKTH